MSSTRQFDLSGLRQTRVKNATTDSTDSTPVAARTQLDSSWKSLSDLESHIYKTIPSEHDSKKLDELIQAARKARQSGSEDAYRDAVIDILNFHLESRKDGESYTPYDYKSDGFLSPKNMVMINARFRGKARSGTDPENLDSAYTNQIEHYRKKSRPDIRPLYSGAPGSWNIQGAKAEADEMYSKGYDSLISLGVSPAEAEYLSRKNTIDTFKLRSTDQNQASLVVTDTDTGNIIVVHMKIDGSGVMTPKASNEDFVGTASALYALRAGGLYKGNVTVHLLDDNSKLPDGISGVDANTIAFTYDKANAINVYVDKVAKQIDIAKQHPGYWSTEFKTLTEAHKHFVAHEVGHQLAEQIFGSQTAKQIESEMSRFYNEPSAIDTSTDSTPQTSSDAAKTIASAQGSSTDLSSWTKVGDARGSNPGGTWEDPTTGQKVYAKFQQTTLHGENERLASALYRFLGVDATDIVPGTVNGKEVTYASYVPGVQTDFNSRIANDPAYKKKVQEGFAVDALLANWDVTLNDNIVTDGNGNPVRIDVGGSLLFRAQGGARGSSFGDNVLELDTYTSGSINPYAVRVFGSMSHQDQTDSAKKLTKLTNADIEALVDSIITDSGAASGLKQTLKNRRDYILGKYGLTGDNSVAARNRAHAASNKVVTNNPVPVISTRGSDSSAENFAELFAKYVVTGDAPEWFLNLLESHGYAKGKKNTSWRKNIVDAARKGILNFIDHVLAEKDSGTYPEKDKSKYGYGTKLGSASAHRLVRALGFNQNTAQIVDELDPTWKRVYRGVGAATVEGTHMTPKDMHKDFATNTAPYFSTTTYHGDGGYSASKKSEAQQYANTSNHSDNSVIEMAINPKAKVAVLGSYGSGGSHLGFSYDSNIMSQIQIQQAVDELLRSIIANEIDPGQDENSSAVVAMANSLFRDLPLTSPTGNSKSNLYGLLGYDAIEINLGSHSYFVILNRGILQVRKKDIN